jgi:hypothetical protein
VKVARSGFDACLPLNVQPRFGMIFAIAGW